MAQLQAISSCSRINPTFRGSVTKDSYRFDEKPSYSWKSTSVLEIGAKASDFLGHSIVQRNLKLALPRNNHGKS
nr:argininosuccinate synthase, chloroplastic [Ipomoea batatas]